MASSDPLRRRLSLPHGVLLPWLRDLLWALLLLMAGPCAAHPMPESRVWFDAAPHGAVATLQIPLDRLQVAWHRPLDDATAAAIAADRDALSRYLQAHVGIDGPAPGWTCSLRSLDVTGAVPNAEIVAVFDLQAPPGADARHFVWRDDAVTHDLRTHRIQLWLRSDWASGTLAHAPQPLGELRHPQDRLEVTLPPAQALGGAVALFRLGLAHIADGGDHLLFLLMLLLVAPLRAAGGRWVGLRPPARALRHVLLLVSGFTLGHSLSLAAACAGWSPLPARALEALVALSIGAAALHALRPLWARAEAALVAGFGVVHGLAFSSGLSTVGLGPWQQVQAVLAFNLGIEAMQCVLLLAMLPPWWTLGRRVPALQAHLRVALGAMALLLSALWTAERLGVQLPRLPAVDVAPLLPLALVALALWGAAWWCSRSRR